MTKEQIHAFRKQIDACIQIAEMDMDSSDIPYGRELALVRTKLQEAKMWAGKCLEKFPENEFPPELRDVSTDPLPADIVGGPVAV